MFFPPWICIILWWICAFIDLLELTRLSFIHLKVLWGPLNFLWHFHKHFEKILYFKVLQILRFLYWESLVELRGGSWSVKSIHQHPVYFQTPIFCNFYMKLSLRTLSNLKFGLWIESFTLNENQMFLNVPTFVEYWKQHLKVYLFFLSWD